MKKFFSFIALAGLLVACQPEEIKTAFKVGSAVAEINVSATDLLTGPVTIDGTTYSLNVDTPTGYPEVVMLASDKISFTTEEAVSLPSGNVTVQLVSGGVVLGESVVYIPRILAGDKYTTSTSIIFGNMPSEYTFSIDGGTYVTTILAADPMYLTTSGAYTHDGNSKWDDNASDSAIVFEGQYIQAEGTELVADVEVLAPEFQSHIDAYASAFERKLQQFKVPYSAPIPAYCYFRVTNQIVANVYIYVVSAQLGSEPAFPIAKIYVGRFANEITCEILEYGAPAVDHGDGHGHGHGGSGSGGGVIIP